MSRVVPMQKAELTDAVILARVADGDLGALGALYDRHAAPLLRFARRLSVEDDAEDIVQITFLRVVRRAVTFDPSVESARPWLFAIAVRISRERRRSLRRFTAALVGLAERSRNASARIPEAERDLTRALANLSHDKRLALLLAEVEGFTGVEIARMLGIPVGTVWTRLHHARKELRRALEGDLR